MHFENCKLMSSLGTQKVSPITEFCGDRLRKYTSVSVKSLSGTMMTLSLMVYSSFVFNSDVMQVSI